MKKKILVRGPVLSQSGYGEQSRFALRALKSREDIFDIYVLPTNWGKTGWVWEESNFRNWMDSKITITQVLLQQKKLIPDISLQITIPIEFEKMCDVNIGYTAGIETTHVAPGWLEKGNMMDKVLVVSNHAKTTYEKTVAEATNNQTGERVPYKMQKPIDVVWECTPRAKPEPIQELNLDYDNNFLFISQLGPRKNFENTIKWWVEEFIDQEVGLVIKTNMKNNSVRDYMHLEVQMKALLEKYKDRKCKVYLLHGDLSSGQMCGLYNNPKIKALINLAHGEGFGLPMFEAAREGLPIITMGWSGQLDFLNHSGKDYFHNVEYTLSQIQNEAVWNGVLEKGSKWAYPDQGSFKMNLRDLIKNYDSAKDRAMELQKIINEKFDPEKLYRGFCDSIYKDEYSGVEVSELPKISLITSVFDADDYIEQLMEDTTRQTIFQEKCEWIILNVDPPGKNNSEEIILKYLEKYPNNIVYKRLEADEGVYDTWNQAIELSTGDFITNVNCDDRRSPRAVEIQAKTLYLNKDVDLVYNDSYMSENPNVQIENITNLDKKYNFEEFSKEAMLRSNLPHNNPMWRKSLHDNHGLFETKYKSAGDWEFWLRCVFAGSKFKKINSTLGVYYFNPTGLSTNKDTEASKRKEEKEVFQTYLKKYQENPES